MSIAARIPNDTVITNDEGNKKPIHILYFNSTYCARLSANHIASILPHLIDAQSNIHTNDDDDGDNGECELTDAKILWNIDVAAGPKDNVISTSLLLSFNDEKYYQLSFVLARWWRRLNCVDNHSNNHKHTCDERQFELRTKSLTRNEAIA